MTTAGTYSFAATNNDDTATVWLLPKRFNATTNPFVAADRLQGPDGNNNTAVSTKSLSAGVYTLVYTHFDVTNGEGLVGRIESPSFQGQTNGNLMPIATSTAGSVNVTSTGTVTFAVANTYHGLTNVSSGTLVPLNANSPAPPDPRTARSWRGPGRSFSTT